MGLEARAYAPRVRRAVLVLAFLALPGAAHAAALTRYSLAGRCVVVAGTPEFFKATGLGAYMLAGPASCGPPPLTSDGSW